MATQKKTPRRRSAGEWARLVEGAVDAEPQPSFPIERAYEEGFFVSLLYYMGLLTLHREGGWLRLVVPNHAIRTLYWEVVTALFHDLDRVEVTVPRVRAAATRPRSADHPPAQVDGGAPPTAPPTVEVAPRGLETAGAAEGNLGRDAGGRGTRSGATLPGRTTISMQPLTIELPETVLLACGQSREEFLREARFLLGLKLFELGRLSSGKAAEMCLMSRADFLFAASRAGVPVAALDDADLADEFRDV